MRIVVAKPTLLKHLQLVERAVNDRSTLPILSNILLQSTEKELILTATDLDVGIQCRFPLSPDSEQGAVALPARKLTTIIRELPDELITLEAKRNHTATMNCSSSRFRIPGLPPEDFPVLPEAPAQGGEGVTLSQRALKRLVTSTAYAMSMEETRFILNGALLTFQKSSLVMVATDGRRLAIAETAATTHGKGAFQMVIPAKTVRELGRLLEEDDAATTLTPIQDNQLAIRFGDVTVITRLIEGQFPPYDKVIPPPSKHRMTCAREPLFNAIRRVSLMTTAASQAVVFEFAQAALVISKESAELGSAREEIPANYTGEPITVAFNPEFWLDALKVVDSDEVTLEVSGSDKPAVLRQPTFTYLVLPMKLG